MYAVILAGGKGKRFWPFSRVVRPKQFLDVTGDGSMLRVTFGRLSEFVVPERIFLLTIKEQLPLVIDELPELPRENIFVEPVGRNTAPSLAVAAAMARERGEDVPVLCCPSDHVILDTDVFRRIVEAAAQVAAERDELITFGIKPTYPATGYGYIEAGAEAGTRNRHGFHRVCRFHEKPELEMARKYLDRGNFFWNSGIFLWRPSVYLSAWDCHLPDGKEPLARIADTLGKANENRTVEVEYPKMPSISVDYGILERADNVLVFPADFDWNDVGSWDALFDILPHDDQGNVGSGGMELIDSKGNLLFNPGGVTAAVGVEDLIVVVNGGTVLVCRRGQSQRIRELIESIEKKGAMELL